MNASGNASLDVYVNYDIIYYIRVVILYLSYDFGITYYSLNFRREFRRNTFASRRPG